jgi:hypothetical protein
MIQAIKNRIFRYSKIAGLEMHASGKSVLYHFIILRRNGESVDIIYKKENISSYDDLIQALPEGIPVALAITGKGVLHKKVDATDDNWKALLEKSLPNADINEFTGQSCPAKNGSLLSIIRKDNLDATIDKLKDLKIVSVHVGLPTINTALPLISDGAYNIADQAALIQSGKLEIIRDKNIAANQLAFVGEEKLASSLLLSFGVALTTILSPNTYPSGYPKAIALKKEYEQERLATLIGWLGLGLLLLSLLLNFFIFSWLNQRTLQLDNAASYNQVQAKELQELKQELETKQTTLNNSSLLKPSKISYYADEIGQIIPTGIRLEKLTLFPNLDEENLQFDKEKIIISGTCQNSAILNLWIKQLEGLDWVKELKVLPYKENTNGIGVFELKLFL